MSSTIFVNQMSLVLIDYSDLFLFFFIKIPSYYMFYSLCLYFIAFEKNSLTN